MEITGFLNDVPVAGDKFESEKQARSVGESRLKAKLDKRNVVLHMLLDDLFSQIKDGEVLDLNIIAKADIQGTAEAVKASQELDA